MSFCLTVVTMHFTAKLQTECELLCKAVKGLESLLKAADLRFVS